MQSEIKNGYEGKHKKKRKTADKWGGGADSDKQENLKGVKFNLLKP